MDEIDQHTNQIEISSGPRGLSSTGSSCKSLSVNTAIEDPGGKKKGARVGKTELMESTDPSFIDPEPPQDDNPPGDFEWRGRVV